MQTIDTKPRAQVRIVWTGDNEYEVYHDAELVEHIWMDNDGRWFTRKAAKPPAVEPTPEQLQLFAGVAEQVDPRVFTPWSSTRCGNCGTEGNECPCGDPS